MRNTVKNSLVLWPLAASTVISTLSAAALWVPPAKPGVAAGSVKHRSANHDLVGADGGHSMSSWMRKQFRQSSLSEVAEPPIMLRRNETFERLGHLASLRSAGSRSALGCFDRGCENCLCEVGIVRPSGERLFAADQSDFNHGLSVWFGDHWKVGLPANPPADPSIVYQPLMTLAPTRKRIPILDVALPVLSEGSLNEGSLNEGSHPRGTHTASHQVDARHRVGMGTVLQQRFSRDPLLQRPDWDPQGLASIHARRSNAARTTFPSSTTPVQRIATLPEVEEIFAIPRSSTNSHSTQMGSPRAVNGLSSGTPMLLGQASELFLGCRTLAKPISLDLKNLDQLQKKAIDDDASQRDVLKIQLAEGTFSRSSGADASTMRIAVVPAPYRYVSVTASSWPGTPALDELLTEVMSQARSRSDLQASWTAWSDNVELELARLRSLPRLADPSAAPILKELVRLGHQGSELGERSTPRAAQVEMLRASAALIRRADVWTAIHNNLQTAPEMFDGETLIRSGTTNSSQTAGHDVAAAIQVLRRDLDQTGDVEGWQQYLLLDEIAAALNDSNSESAAADRLELAQRLLGRLHWHEVEFDARDFLQRPSVEDLATAIRPWAGGAVDYVKLLLQIERQESDPTASTAAEIADAIATLGHSENPAVRAIAQSLATHYQNANVRFAISERLVNRFVPTIDPQTVPLQTTVLGSRVRGQSTVDTNLGVRLRPSPDRWSLELLTNGDVATTSIGTRDGVAVKTFGQNQFAAGKPIQIAAGSMLVGDTDVSVTGRTQLRSIETRYDRWPLVGALVQSIAGSEFERLRPVAQRTADRRIQQEIRQKVDQGVADKTDEATQRLTEMLVGPLSRLQLDPGVVQLQTTQDRLLARYRVAGQWQLAAFTPRPRALSTSLMSAQVHQSVFNNTIEQLIPRGEPMTISQIMNRSARTLNQDAVLPADIPDDVTVQFADTRPVTIEIEDDRFWVTMRIASLRRDGGRPLTRFIVKAAYRAEADGLKARLVREGHLSIRGPGMSMSERLPIRLIFNKVLSDDRPIELTLPSLADNPAAEGLVISQLELRDGWIALSVSETDTPRIALR